MGLSTDICAQFVRGHQRTSCLEKSALIDGFCFEGLCKFLHNRLTTTKHFASSQSPFKRHLPELKKFATNVNHIFAGYIGEWCICARSKWRWYDRFCSSSLRLSPLLTRVIEPVWVQAMNVGFHCGVSKPSDVGGFVKETAPELTNSLREGIKFDDVCIRSSLLSVMCNTPAGAFVWQVN